MLEEDRIELRRAWVLRQAQKLEHAEQALKKLQARKSQDLFWQIEVQLFEASLLRARRQIDESETLLQCVKQQLENSALPVPFQYYFQRGLNLYYRGYFPSALEFMSRAQEIASDDEARAWALGNQMCSLDNLNLPLEIPLARLKSLAATLPENDFVQTIQPQLHTFECRRAFRAGNLSQALSEIPAEVFSQAEYFQLWVCMLPYVHTTSFKADIGRFIAAPHLVWKNYRAHTLRVDSRYPSEEAVKISERIDRLYLWLWKWMMDPQSLPVTALEKCWAELDPCEICSQTAVEDFVLLKLCLRWTRLWDPRWQLASEEWLKKSWPPHLREPELFIFEGLVLDYFEALRAREKKQTERALEKLQNHPLWSSPHLRFRELVEASEGPLAALAQRLLPVKPEKSAGAVLGVLRLNLGTYQWKFKKQEGVSKPLCLLMKALNDFESLSFDEILQSCFGIDAYDEDLHRHKVMNLLTRVRKVLPPSLKIFTKDQHLHVQGDFRDVQFENRLAQRTPFALPRLFERPCLEQNQHHMDRWIQPSLVVKKLQGKNKVTRQELQDLLRISKASTNRLLRRWVNEGFLVQSQAGRSICYHIDNTYFFRLKSRDS